MNRIEAIYDDVVNKLNALNLNSVNVNDLNDVEIMTMMRLAQYLDHIRKAYSK